MSLSAAEFYEAGMNLPPSVRKALALRLLESVEAIDESTSQHAWTTEIHARLDDVTSGDVQAVPGERVFADLASHRATRDS